MELDTFGMSRVTVAANIGVDQNLKCENMSSKVIDENLHSNNSEHRMGYKI